MKKVFIAASILFAVSILFSWFLVEEKSPKIAYVELETLYNNFQMKKELEAKLTNVQQMRKSILDSLKIKLNAMSLEIKSEKETEAIQKFQIKKQEYLMKQKSFDEDNQNTTKNYNDQIWKHINQYVKDFGKKETYMLIIGADNNGSVMYSKENLNVTSDVSEYINERYKGENVK